MIPEGAELTLKSIKLHGEKVIPFRFSFHLGCDLRESLSSGAGISLTL